MDRLSFLPTIKCSNCAVDIEISQLADHVCAAAATAPAQPTGPTSPKLDRAATFAGPSLNDRVERPTGTGRNPPPPRIDPYAANKPFRPPEPSPGGNSHGGQKTRSPLSPLSPGKGRGPFKMNRSATSPMPRAVLDAPLPDLPSNMDCAFPPFPTKRSATPSSSKSKSRERLEPNQRHAEASPLFAPLSPRTNGGEKIAKRMDTIAPGPFDGRDDRRPSTSNGPGTSTSSGPGFGHRRTATQGSAKSNGFAANDRSSMASNASGRSIYSTTSSGLPSRLKPGSGSVGAMPPPPPPPPPPLPQSSAEGIDAFLDRLQRETMGPSKAPQEPRSNPVPMRSEGKDAMQPPPRPRRPSETDRNNASMQPADVDSSDPTPRPTNMFPARSSSRGGSKSGIRRDEAPPLPPVPTYAKEAPLNPMHTPSDSGQSDDSFSSAGFRSVASSRSSPPTSEAAHSRQASKAGRIDYGETMQRTASPELLVDIRPPPLQPLDRKDPGVFDRERVPEPLQPSSSKLPPNMTYADLPESPMDPAIQRGMNYERRLVNPAPLRDPALNLGQSPPECPIDFEPRRQMTRRPTAANRGKCRGCSEPIIGKSVKDSSGRLTGRYHKACFNCRTCGDPFPTADFYVFNNAPYCEQHYHELNGSLCQSCNRGIEGQYLETDVRQKFHPRCFSCWTCRIILRDDYYEVGGRNYCDRHAFHAASQQKGFLGPGGNRSMRNPQKRRTRLMMMA